MTRWPALDVAAKRARLNNSLHLSPGLADAVASSTAIAERAAAALVASATRRPGAATQRCSRRSPIGSAGCSSPVLMADSIDRLQTFAAGIKRDGFTDVVLLGMGGSSLAPEVLRAVIGVAPGWPRLHMLDSTDPAAVRAVATPPDRTLYLLASKSGTTIEPNSLAAHFRQRLQDAGIAALGRSLRRDHRRGHRARTARARGALPRRLHQPVRHRRPLLGAVVLRHGAGGADGTGHRRRSSAGRWRCSPRREPGAATAVGQPRRRRSAW